MLVADQYIAEDVIISKNLTLAPGQAQPSIRTVTALASTTDVQVTVTGLTSRAGYSRVRGFLAPGGGNLTLTVTGSQLRGSDFSSGLELITSNNQGAYGAIVGSFRRNTVIQNGSVSDCAPAVNASALNGRMAVTVDRNDVRFTGLGQCAAVQMYSSGGAMEAVVRGNQIQGGDTSAGILLRAIRGTLRGAVVNNLVVARSSEVGIEVSADGSNGAIDADVRSNTVAEAGVGARVSARTDLGSAVSGLLANNLLANHAQGAILVENGLNMPNHHNLVFASGPLPPNGYQPHGPNTRTGNPSFMNRADGDYRLLATSDAIDHGDNALMAGLDSTDLNGQPRQVRVLDIGAYEFQGEAMPAEPGAGVNGIPTLGEWSLLSLAVALGGLGARARQAKKCAPHRPAV
ncbi:MAG: IPTL-CTERM sorting domain-containing protein [Burkholderiaceae bacterium]